MKEIIKICDHLGRGDKMSTAFKLINRAGSANLAPDIWK